MVRPTSSVAEISPRLSFGSWAFSFGPFESDPWAFEDVCRYVADAGYDGIEINGFRPHPHDEDYRDPDALARLKDLLTATGLGVSGFAPDFTATPPADVDVGEYLARIDSTLDFCSELDVGILRVDSVSPPGAVDLDRFKRLAAAWRASAVRCADRGVLLVWEFEPGFWLNRPSEVLSLVEAVDHSGFRLLFDTSHAYTGSVSGARQGANPEVLTGGVLEYASLVAEHIGHLHLIDSDGSLHDNETSEHLPFGDGRVPFAEVIDVLGDHARALPWWTVDFCYCPTTETDGRRAVPFVRQLLADATSRRLA
jgi:sugar phosphate isomerase/epimerase